MVKMKIRMLTLSVSQSMANRKTFQQFALINSEIVSFMDYSDGLVLKVHFLVMLGFLWLIVYCKRYWFQRLTLWLLHGRAHAHEPITFTINSQSRVRVRVNSFFLSENQKIIMEQKYEKLTNLHTNMIIINKKNTHIFYEKKWRVTENNIGLLGPICW